MARYVLVDPVINSSNDKQRDYSITGRGSESDLGFICYPWCYPQQKMGYGLNHNPLF